MHKTAIEDAQKFYDKYVKGTTPVTILDIGSMAVKGQEKKIGTLRDIFKVGNYIGIDIADGINVDEVYDGKVIPYGTESVSIVVSTSCLEHDPCFWKTFAEMARVLEPGGLLYINVPSAGHVHRFPLDCFRFFPDAWIWLAEDNGLTILEQYINQDCYWKNNVVIFRK